MACHYVDPQCLLPGFGLSASREHGVSFFLTLNLRHKRYTETINLVVDGAGGVKYFEMEGDMTTCRRASDEEAARLAKLWLSDAMQTSLPQCGPGFAYLHYGDRASCRESRRQLGERRLAFRLPHAEVRYSAEEPAVSFSWDMESELPEELEEAFMGTLGLLCERTRGLARNLRRSLPELAAKAGCLSAGP